MNTVYTYAAVAVVQLLVSPMLHAETANSTANEPIEKLIITSSRMDKPLSAIPNTVTVIDQEQLKQQLAASRDLSSILGNLAPSFSPSRQKMSNTGETLRGRTPLIMIDGVPQSNPLRSGGRAGQTIDPAMIERIEIIHGANALHGLGAQGGIINYITKKPQGSNEHRVSFNVSAPTDYESDGLSYGANYAFSGHADKLDMLGSVGYQSSGVYYDADGKVIGVDTTQGESMDSQSKDFFLKLAYDLGGSQLQLMINHYDMANNGDWMPVNGDYTNNIPTAAVKQKQPWDAANNKVTTSSLSYKNLAVAGQQLEIQLFNQNFKGVYGGGCFASFYDPAYANDSNLTRCGAGNDGEQLFYEQSRNKSNKWGLKTSLIANNIADSAVDVAYGLDLFRDTTEQDLLQTGRSWVPETKYNNIAPYLQLSYSPIKALNLSSGLRYEYAQLDINDFATLWASGNKQVTGGKPDFNKTLFNIGISYNFTEELRLYSSFNQGFSMADIGRILRDGNSFPGDAPSVNRSLTLTPVVTDNYEFGVDYQGSLFASKLALYRSTSDNGARLSRNADGFYTVAREKSAIEGLEASLRIFLGQDDDLGSSLALQRGEYDADKDGSTDTDLDGSNIAPNRLNLYWEHRFSDEMSSRIQANYFMDRHFTDKNGDRYAEFDGYTTVDASLALPLFGGEMSLGLQNLLNKDYYTYYSQTVPSNSRYFKGMGRTISIGFSLPL
ncbi:TonB-dependent receptor [Shewanella dokdonensis]|uniref:TonB-dependent receptor n=1 Tax=Shewanella dokdonensis TaxID=712036 RepID=UPI003D161A6C